ncbi:ABC transporter permease [Streptomyces botrytidirepellens]|uniref:Transport permease protein n=1 Tax=Streptomyces botrytidirepellens TaxID=2486417 RepID=A0A3M8WYF1_9ACTN|nr:ABC transporter permease [Streptomyces botrytidirepellens]RNG33555.1 ABC transporter permease [Streptomyces botrytidirepellens]
MSDRSPAPHPLRDSMTMLRRNLLHARRYPSMTIGVTGMPVIMLLLFVYVFGTALSTGLGGGGDRSAYIAYVVPGILLMTVGSGTVPTAVAVCTDMAEGIVARFRTMAISRSSVLVGHVVGSVVQTMISLAVVTGVALAIGFRSDAGAVEWLAAAGVLALACCALTWLAVGMGLASPTPEAASNAVLPLSFLLPFISSAFVPVDAMPGWIRWFAEYQPFTTVVETLRGLLTGTEIGHNGWLSVAWCLAITLLGYVWSQRRFARDPR